MISFSARRDAWCRGLTLILLLLASLTSKALFSSQLQEEIGISATRIDQISFKLPEKAQNNLKENLPSLSPTQPKPASKGWSYSFLYSLFVVMAVSGMIPVITFFIEHNISGLHALTNHFKKCADYCPRVAVIIPAWNEALVLEHTLDILLKIDYPLSSLRFYIIDDGSTDNTLETISMLHLAYPETVLYVRKEGGGNGKAHAVNYGLNIALADPWTEAIMLIDADISFKKDALRLMARHLADPQVGAVTAYIKVGNRNTNYVTRSIGYEYIVSQAVARRAQNVLGVVACLAGGAQLHSRANLEALGGQIDTTTLAEDTFTTFATQKIGKKVIYEGNAFVYAEEPTAITDVWKQRFRWARGNLQITKAFKDVWFHSHKSCLGNILFGIIWFCVILTPIVMILSAVGLVGLFILDKQHSAHIFFYLASISLFVYLYTTILAILVDRKTSRLAWFEGIIYPGLISLSILAISINPDFFFKQLNNLFNIPRSSHVNSIVLLFMETWSALCMVWAWVVFRLEFAGLSARITNFLLVIVGYGPLLCTINLAAYIAELKRPNLKWDKTEKISSKRVIYPHNQPANVYNFEKALYRDQQREYRFLCREILSLVIVSGLFLLFYSL